MTAAGMEFVVAFLSIHRCIESPILHMITPYVTDVEVTVKTPVWESVESFDLKFNINSSGTVNVSLPISLCIGSSSVQNKTVYITSTKPIFVYAAFIQTKTGDYFVLYPVISLGTVYIASGYTNKNNNEDSFIGCIALSANTEVSVHVPFDQNFQFDNVSYAGDSVINIFLSKYQVARIIAMDVSGSIIESNKPIAVFSGNVFVMIPGPTRTNGESTNGGDLIMAQLQPITSMSTIYPVVATHFNDEEWIRVFAIYDNTSFYIHNTSSYQMHVIENKGSFYEVAVPKSSAVTIISTKPVNVVQYSASSDNYGDARMIITLSLDNYVSEYMFVIPNGPNTEKFKSFINVIATESSLDRIYLDDINIMNLTTTHMPVSCGYRDLVSVWFTVDQGKHDLKCVLTNYEYCTVYIHGVDENNQYGTEANRFISSSQSFKSSMLEKKEVLEQGSILTTIHNIVAENKRPSFPPHVIFRARSSLECHVICRRYENCALIAFDKANLTCDLYLLFAATSTLEDKAGTNIFMIGTY